MMISISESMEDDDFLYISEILAEDEEFIEMNHQLQYVRKEYYSSIINTQIRYALELSRKDIES